VFISHGHFDHIADVASIVKRIGALVISNLGVNAWFHKMGITHTHLMNLGGKWKFDFGEVRCVIAQHSSSLPDGSYGGSSAGYVFMAKEKNFYYSGDTALTMDMQLIAEWTKLDFMVLPIGDNLTMGIEDAVRLAQWLEVKRIVAVHYDTFELIKVDHEKVMEYCDSRGIQLHLLEIESINEF
jgi:L-ascorbate metabolism protein UlaG (beta-lactamase superfamily)